MKCFKPGLPVCTVRNKVFFGVVPVVPYRSRKPIENLFAPSRSCPTRSSLAARCTRRLPSEHRQRRHLGQLEFSIQNGTTFVQLHWLDFNKNHTSGHRYRNSRLCQWFVLMGLIGCDTSNHWLLLGPATGRWDASKDRLQPGGDRFGLLYWCSLI